MEDTNDGCFLQPHDLAFHHRRGAPHAQQLPRQTSLAEEIALSKDRNDCFFPLFGKNGDFDLALAGCRKQHPPPPPEKRRFDPSGILKWFCRRLLWRETLWGRRRAFVHVSWQNSLSARA